MSLRTKITDWLDDAEIRAARIAKAEGVEDLDAYAKGCLCLDVLAYEVGYRDALAYVLQLLPVAAKRSRTVKDVPPWLKPSPDTGPKPKRKRRGSP